MPVAMEGGGKGEGEANDLLSTFILAVPPFAAATVPRSFARSARRPQGEIRKARPPPWPPNRVSSQDADFSSVRPSSRSHQRPHWRGNFFLFLRHLP